MKNLILMILVALSVSGPDHSSWREYSSKSELISYQIPINWQVESEGSLERIGYLQPPYPAYVLIAGAEPTKLSGVPNPPSVYAFSETPSPWLMVLVERGATPVPPANKAYELALEGEVTLQEEQGLDPTVAMLTRPADVSSGGLHGSQDRSEVIVPGAGDIELNQVVYVRGRTAWTTVAGCTVACYNANVVTLGEIIGSVRVGAAAL